MVTSGRIVRGKVRVRRKKDVIYEGVTQSLRRFQDEANEVRAGMECGIRIEGFGEFQVGDAIECYAVEKIAAKL
jgi:translation initiation factor IF-2